MSRDLKSFQADLARFAQREQDKALYLFRRGCSVVSENISVGGEYGPGTPVDTGFARNSWVDGLNAPGEYVQPAKPGDHVVVVPRPLGSDVINQLQLGDRYFKTSNCVYQRRLDNGHSQQAPNGHVLLVVDQLPQIFADVAHEDLPLFAGGGNV